MILDSSAICAILLDEPQRTRLEELLARDSTPRVGTPTLVETGMVMVGRMGAPGRGLIRGFLGETGTSVVPFGPEHWPVALHAFQRFGRGQHPAKLNLGDCLTYAIAKLADEPLLCIGDEFAKTDLVMAV